MSEFLNNKTKRFELKSLLRLRKFRNHKFEFFVHCSAPKIQRKMRLRPWLEIFGKTFYQNGSIDTCFDPPLFSLVSTFQYYLRKEFPKLRAFIFSHCRDLPYSLWNWGNGGKFRRPLLYTILSVYGSLSASLQRQLSFPFSSFSTLSSAKLYFLFLFYSEGNDCGAVFNKRLLQCY
jgi:hypothetical protein